MNNVDFIYKPTKATWKIKNLIKNGLSKFKPNEQKIFIIQGGQGAGKTISILMLLIDALNSGSKEITICSNESTKLSDTALRDFIKILKDWNIYHNFKHNSSENTFTTKQSYCEFIGLDKKDIGKGRRRDIIYINEANKVTLHQFNDISARAKIIIIDYNPDAKFWAHDLINSYNFINLTYLDNEFLPTEEVSNIENYKRLGFYEDGTIKNEYYSNLWRVYGLGEIGQTTGKIFSGWKKCNYETFLKIDTQSYYGVDFGVSDPFAIVEVKYKENTMYVNELNYKSENELKSELTTDGYENINTKDGGILLHTFAKVGIPKDAVIICDSAYIDYIALLRKKGYKNAIASNKGAGSIMFGISLINKVQIVYTENSSNLENEYENYVFMSDRQGILHDKPIDKFNHTIDALRYIANFLHYNKVL